MLDGPSVSWGSEAVPEKLTVSPEAQVSDDDGVVIVAVGGEFPGWTTKLETPVAPWPSVTSSFTVTFALAEYEPLAVTPVASSYWPSPSRSHLYVNEDGGPSSVVADASNVTASGVGPQGGVAVNEAIGGWLPLPNASRRLTVPLAMSTK